jgi:hypothetical protein
MYRLIVGSTDAGISLGLTILGHIIFRRRLLHDEELRDLYPSPSKIRMIKSRRMRWSGHVARMGEEERV